jgi:alkylated DNA repair dioxygenase AlkB
VKFREKNMELKTISEKDGILQIGQLFSTKASDDLFIYLEQKIEWEQQWITIRGEKRPIPRKTAWYGTPEAKYTYSGIENEPKPMTPILDKIREILEKHTHCQFNSVLLNYYRSGRDSIYWHSDDEPELGKNPTIASISLGATRTFHLRHKITKELIQIPLTHGTLLIMAGEIQHKWEHSIPKEPTIRKPRINLTFRYTHPRT